MKKIIISLSVLAATTLISLVIYSDFKKQKEAESELKRIDRVNFQCKTQMRLMDLTNREYTVDSLYNYFDKTVK